MLDKIIRTVGNEILDEVGDEITDLLFGKFKEMAFVVAIVVMMLVVYFIFVGVQHTFN